VQVGVFVSIVSTKIPFKGAGKEYIGDDITEMVAAVKHAIQQCCLQVGCGVLGVVVGGAAEAGRSSPHLLPPGQLPAGLARPCLAGAGHRNLPGQCTALGSQQPAAAAPCRRNWLADWQPPTALPQLKTKISRALAAREQKQRKRNLTKYIPNCCDALWAVLEKMAAAQPGGPKRRRLEAGNGLLAKVRVEGGCGCGCECEGGPRRSWPAAALWRWPNQCCFRECVGGYGCT
jgi:hypothetical protein